MIISLRKLPGSVTLSAVFLILVIVSSLFSLVFSGAVIGHIDTSLLGTPQPPSFAHPLGTDELGRDYFVRLLYAGNISLMIAFTSVVIAIILGLMVGIVAGYFGGIVDSVLMRFVDAMLSFPTIFLILIIQVIFHTSLLNIILIIGLTSWMGVARIIRSEVLVVKNADYIAASRLYGGSSLFVMSKHVLPNVIYPIVVVAALGMGGAILTEAVISFLGLGVQPPLPSWGNMLINAQNYLVHNYWWLLLFPGLMILGSSWHSTISANTSSRSLPRRNYDYYLYPNKLFDSFCNCINIAFSFYSLFNTYRFRRL